MNLSKKQKQQRDYEHFLRSYHGGQLLSQHSLDEVGIWQVFGEDPNCDMGGYHHEPFLGLLEGKLDDVIYEAVTLGGFFQWGGGGKINKYKAPGVQKAKTRAERDNVEYEELLQKRKELEKQLAGIDAELAKTK